MFGLSKKERAAAILRQEFGIHRSIVIEPLLRVFDHKDGNEFDLAILFVIGRSRALNDGSEQCERQIALHLEVAEQLVLQAAGDRDELWGLIDLARENRSLRQREIYGSFDNWLRIFKRACGEVNRVLEIDNDGKSLIDFLDHSGFRLAFEDRVSPEYLGSQFGASFELPSV